MTNFHVIAVLSKFNARLKTNHLSPLIPYNPKFAMPLPPVPPVLKIFNTFLLRSRELEQADPVISYYCKFYVAEEILGRNLHRTSDTSVTDFVGSLMDELEEMRSENPKLASEEGQAILADDDVAKSYVEGFALNVFANADKDVYNKTSTIETTKKFMAAATFLELLKVFAGDDETGEPKNTVDKDIAEKIKYSKFQAARIAKAIKNGENPNDYTPPQPTKTEQEEIDDLLAGAVESAKLDDEESDPSAASSAPNFTNSQGGFPDFIDDGVAPSTNTSSPPHAASPPASSFDNYFVSVPTVAPRAPPSPIAPSAPSQPTYSYSPPPPTAPVVASPPPEAHHHLNKQQVQSILDESELISVVQKHCKFAISALTYEDMKTAMKELSTAMDLLKKNVPESELY